VLPVCLIVVLLIGIIAWVMVTAPNAMPLSPRRREKEWWG
jgi:hypothetical protein